MIRLLHLSDIHFKTPECLNPDTDLDGVIRDLFLVDLEQLISQDDKNIDAVLITGDIAYKADPSEFRFASEWIDELCGRLSLDPAHVFTVPGNHDVNRNDAKGVRVMPQRAHIMSLFGHSRTVAHREAFADEETCRALLSPSMAYNEFAKKYGCEISGQKLRWASEIKVDESFSIILNGLTSTLFSGEDDCPMGLYLSPEQCVFRAKSNSLHLIMMHHPVDWFENMDEIRDTLNSSTAIQLTGHKHKSRWEVTNGRLHIAAGALHPDRYESGAEPGYNIIDIDVIEESESKAHLEVSAHIRILQDNPSVFRAKVTESGDSKFRHTIPIVRTKIKEKLANEPLPELPEDNCETRQETNKISVFEHFFALPESRKRDILNRWKLLDSDTYPLGTDEINKAFCLAVERGIERGLYQEILFSGESK